MSPLTLNVELVDCPRTDVESLAPVAKSEEGEDGREERRGDEIQSSKLVYVGRLDSRRLGREGQQESG